MNVDCSNVVTHRNGCISLWLDMYLSLMLGNVSNNAYVEKFASVL